MRFLGRLSFRKPPPPVDPTSEKQPDAQEAAQPTQGEFTGENRTTVLDGGTDALDLMADSLFRSGCREGWFDTPSGEPNGVITGVCIRSKYGGTRSHPLNHPLFRPFEDAVFDLNARVALKIRSKAVEYAMKSHITVHHLALARKSQYAAFVRDEGVLCVWADRVEDIIDTGLVLQKALVNFLWSDEADQLNRGCHSPRPESKLPTGEPDDRLNPGPMVEIEDPEKRDILAARKLRPVALIAPVTTGCASALAVIILSFGLRALVIRWIYDGNPIRFILTLVLPPMYFIILFPALVFISVSVYAFGPIAQYHQNSASYSGIRPSRASPSHLMPITVQMPVYKESLEDVLIPTLESVQRATTVFERQGGVVNVIVCDDGLQVIGEEERARRLKYYKDHNLAFVARPPHGSNGFERRGRFKKAGNLNHCNALSLRVEDIMHQRRPTQTQDTSTGSDIWTELDESELYEEAFATAVNETDGATWANGNIRIGEIILLIDSDTRVPGDCFMDASLEMSASPEVAIIQHASGVMQVAHQFFENGMAFFTRNLQVAISYTVASGDVAPFVGHNAFLRWRALQECASPDDYDGVSRIWSESHVSEDFQISLKLQTLGWTLRWAAYSDGGFQEGVSLTCADELARWQKYAYGVSEIVFHPIRYWPTRGPLTKQFRAFLGSNMAPHAKCGIMGYIFSYYAISLACTGSIINYAFVGIWAMSDSFYSTSWNVLFVCLLLFMGLHNVVFCLLRYRLKLPMAGSLAVQQFKWIPFFALFFGGLSLSITQAFISHLFSLNMSWTTTAKTVVKSNFFLQVPRIWRRFWFQIVLSLVVLAGMIISTTAVTPPGYRVTQMDVIVPLAVTYGCHLIWPFALDTDITTFTARSFQP
ncbi:hypothetical protein JCM24511_05658 [Saitozyma sp. JCM 24511]|nr:hypothetical protein JCM24511_05658 [Saitozyma sp. JCM 24511]